jgi:hypothetical protein
MAPRARFRRAPPVPTTRVVGMDAPTPAIPERAGALARRRGQPAYPPLPLGMYTCLLSTFVHSGKFTAAPACHTLPFP